MTSTPPDDPPPDPAAVAAIAAALSGEGGLHIAERRRLAAFVRDAAKAVEDGAPLDDVLAQLARAIEG